MSGLSGSVLVPVDSMVTGSLMRKSAMVEREGCLSFGPSSDLDQVRRFPP